MYSLTNSSRFESSRIDSDRGSNRLRLTKQLQRLCGLLTMAALRSAYTPSDSSRFESGQFESNRLRLTKERQSLFGLLRVAALGLCKRHYSLVDSKPRCLAESRTLIPQVSFSPGVFLEPGVTVDF